MSDLLRRWFPLWRPRPAARWRLLCLPFAGGGASAYREWQDALPDIEVLAAQLPGREHRIHELPVDDLTALLAGLRQAVAALPAGAPLGLCGHSFGALLAFALTRELVVAGAPPAALIATGARAPHCPPRRILHDLPLPALLQEMIRLGGTSPRVLAEPELLALLEPMLRADLRVAERSVLPVSPALPVPIAVFGGTEDPQVAPADLQAWSAVAANGCTVSFVPGGHFFVRDARAELCARIVAFLHSQA
ncbi:MAG: thioesterase [Planctomycetes bacterium]|nr:thioesterase [Planctomycetota bacterium]